jgi:hypothetical protein
MWLNYFKVFTVVRLHIDHFVILSVDICRKNEENVALLCILEGHVLFGIHEV